LLGAASMFIILYAGKTTRIY